MQSFSTSPREMAASFWRHRRLAISLVKREVVGRYRGSTMGLTWSFFSPLIMLAIYTLVFSTVLKVRWGTGEDSKVDFAILLFVGMIVHGLFAECANRAPGLILANVSFVKKVVFPLEILPWVAFGSALFHACVSVIALLLAQLVFRQQMPWTVVLFPIVLVPLVLTTLGFSWALAALGVYIRDVGQMVGLFTLALMFVSPVMYPLSAVPDGFREVLQLNPLTFIIEEGRNTLIFGRVPDFGYWALMVAAGFAIAWAGFAGFQMARKGFADVV